MMTTRYCIKCAAEVPDHGGYCLLGHSLKVQSEAVAELEFTSMDDLETELERTFQEATAQVAAALAQAIEPQGATERAVPEQAGESETPVTTGVVAAIERAFDEPVELPAHDPIAAFSPPPRMDWGPERNPLKKRFSRRRPIPQDA
jgi:hypothetical protein